MLSISNRRSLWGRRTHSWSHSSRRICIDLYVISIQRSFLWSLYEVKFFYRVIYTCSMFAGLEKVGRYFGSLLGKAHSSFELELALVSFMQLICFVTRHHRSSSYSLRCLDHHFLRSLSLTLHFSSIAGKAFLEYLYPLQFPLTLRYHQVFPLPQTDASALAPG